MALDPCVSRDLPDASQVPWGSSGRIGQPQRRPDARELLFCPEGRSRSPGVPDASNGCGMCLSVSTHRPSPVPAAEAKRGPRRATTPVARHCPRQAGRRARRADLSRKRRGSRAKRSSGLDGEWRERTPAPLTVPSLAGPAALLSPFDRLVHDRDRAMSLLRLRSTSSRCTSQ